MNLKNVFKLDKKLKILSIKDSSTNKNSVPIFLRQNELKGSKQLKGQHLVSGKRQKYRKRIQNPGRHRFG